MGSDREIVVSRMVRGPRELVFEVCTDPRHLDLWWGPNGFTTATSAFELRVGGVWEFVMHGSDGTDFPNWVQWQEIVSPERLVFLHGERADDPEAFTSYLTFVETAEGTAVTMRAVFATKEQRDKVVEHFGAIEGGKQTLARLDAYIRSRES